MPGDAFAAHLRTLCHPTGSPSEQPAPAIKISDEHDTVFPRTEPFVAQLTALLRSLSTRDQGFLILDRPGESGYFAQACFDRAASSFLLEYRDGEPEVLYGAVTDDVEVAATVLAGWVDRLDGWSQSLAWEAVPIS